MSSWAGESDCQIARLAFNKLNQGWTLTNANALWTVFVLRSLESSMVHGCCVTSALPSLHCVTSALPSPDLLLPECLPVRMGRAAQGTPPKASLLLLLLT